MFQDKTENLAWDDDRLSEAKIVAENSDVVVLVVGLDESLEGEEGEIPATAMLPVTRLTSNFRPLRED